MNPAGVLRNDLQTEITNLVDVEFGHYRFALIR